MKPNDKLSPGRVIQLLGTLAHGWPDNLMLFPHGGRLYLINRQTGKVYWDTSLILADASNDAVASVDERGGQFFDW